MAIAVDIRTLVFSQEGNRIMPVDIIKLYKESGVLVYDGSKGVPPIIIGDDEAVKLINYNNKEGKRIADRLIRKKQL